VDSPLLIFPGSTLADFPSTAFCICIYGEIKFGKKFYVTQIPPKNSLGLKMFQA
jgi:hypothetical protein